MLHLALAQDLPAYRHLFRHMRVLLTDESSQAREAIEQFVSRAAEQIAAMAVSLNGFDVLVFTGGIGQRIFES